MIEDRKQKIHCPGVLAYFRYIPCLNLIHFLYRTLTIKLLDAIRLYGMLYMALCLTIGSDLLVLIRNFF